MTLLAVSHNQPRPPERIAGGTRRCSASGKLLRAFTARNDTTDGTRRMGHDGCDTTDGTRRMGRDGWDTTART
jgi:hypothetical protein